MAADLLTTIRSELDARLGELRPLLSEYERLVAAVEALGIHATGERVPAPAAEVTPMPAAEPTPVGLLAAPRRRGRPRGSAAGTIKLAAAGPDVTESVTETVTQVEAESRSYRERVTPAKRERAPKGAARQAIIAALEHGSHTISELAMVTAMSGPNINGNIRRLLQEGTIVKTSREGKTAYALVQRAA